MRFAMACIDRHRFVFQTFIEAGWHPLKLFVLRVNNRTEFNQQVIAYAQQLGIDIQLSPIIERDLSELAGRGCETLVVAEHGTLIPDWRPFLSYAINFHPSPLPEARGAFPAIQAILEGRRQWAVTCHKISDRLDRGDILGSEGFAVDCNESLDTFDIKVQLAAQRLAERIAGNFTELWAGARPQGKGSYWKRLGDEQRVLDFSQSVEEILRRIRAFGWVETIAKLDRLTLYVRRADGWTENHSHPPGTIVQQNRQVFLVAAADGYISLLDWSPTPPELADYFKR